MLKPEDRKIKHLYSRAGFGIDLQTWKELEGKPLKKAIRKVMKGAETNIELSAGQMEELDREQIKNMGKEARKERQKENRLFIKELNIAWFRRMAFSEAQLREKMTLFWHDHFACRLNLYGMVFRQNNTFRNYGLGKFRDLLIAVSKDPGMLQFLNNQQNKKKSPNENFARELMELFTLGRGHYTEQDIKEAARAFTGWGFNFKGEFVFRERQHDFGRKAFMGKSGNFNGEDIIDIILEQKRCARFLTEKIYKYFVNQKIDETQVDEWANYFYDTEYDIGKLLFKVFTSRHFYEERNRGTRIKSPVELLVGMMRHINMDIENPDGLIRLQKLLGQVLFQPPNVAGWPEGRSWVDSSSLLSRLRIPEMLVRADVELPKVKDDFSGNEDIIRAHNSFRKSFKTDIDWEDLLETIAKSGSSSKAFEWCQDYLLAEKRIKLSEKDLQHFIKRSDQGETMKWMLVRLMGSPEYQFC
ncbi:MAG: DUF1800 domain-containing protein [Bacteroidia bacterium]|nr:DUF1800 domain-containing protein [Bacteroidia bacterium]